MVLREVFCISCLSLGDVMPKSLRMSTIDWCMVPQIHFVIMIGGRPFQLCSWRWGIREPYLSCLRVMPKSENLLLQCVNLISWMVMEGCGEKGGECWVIYLGCREKFG